MSEEPNFTSMRDAVLEFEKTFDSQNEYDFFSTGYEAHDKALGRLRRGSVVFVGARPSMGKTALLLSWALKQLEAGIRVFFFTLEMPRLDMVARIVSIKTGVRLLDILERKLEEDEVHQIVKALPEIKMLPGDWATDQPLPAIEKLFRQIPSNSRSVAYVDFLGLIYVPDIRPSDQYAAVSQIGLALKRQAMTLNIPVITSVQLNRQVEQRKDREPQLSDFRDSGRLEEVADLALGLYRPGFYDNETTDDELQVFCLKNRNGPRLNYVLKWDKECAAVRERSRGLSWTE
jgi:replicative DNA helicase